MQNRNGSTHSSALAVGFALGLAALGVLALTSVVSITGCGGSSSGTSSVASTTPAPGTEQIAVAAMPATPTPPAIDKSPVAAMGDSLPPDVMVTVEDSTAAPGGVVSITAVGSDDVSQVGLSDGLGRMQLFTREPASNLWHVLYRVPIRTTKDRIALSVTALNDVNRWRRVWVFVPVKQSTSEESGGSEE